MSKIEFRTLLYEINDKLDENELPKLVYMCKDEIGKGSGGNIRDVLTLFDELEKQNRLGIDRLDTLKEILTQMKKRSLLKKVEEFEIKRKAQSVGIVSALKRAAACITGAIKLVCNVRTIAGGLLVVTSGMALRRCSSLDEFMEVFNKVVLVSYSKLVEISEGSLCFTVQAETASALKELWDIYISGTLKSCLQEFLVTEEIKQLASGEDVTVTGNIDEQEYKEAYLDLMLLENQVSDFKEEKRPGGRRRRNSDSFLCFKPNEDDATLMRLKQAEKKWNFERQTFVEENKKLKTEIAEAGNVQRRMFWHEEESAQETEDIGRPGTRRRSNSDSNLYFKARDGDIGTSKMEPKIYLEETKYLDSEKEAFVQSYLQNIHETNSMVTETSDSGITTHDFSQTHCFKDISRGVARRLSRRLDGDEVALRGTLQSFGIRSHFRSSNDIFELFPDTPVKLLKDVFEALQLYDLVDLLSEKPQKAKSLRLALPLQEIEKMRETADGRPTTYHSSAAVLIIADKENSSAEGIENFFKGLSPKSDVTIIDCNNASRMENELEDMDWLNFTARHERQWKRLQMLMRLSKGSQKKQKEERKEIQKKTEELQKEIENIKTAASAVIDSWIHNQGNFSLFAVMLFRPRRYFPPTWTTLLESVKERLVSGIVEKIKFIIGDFKSVPEPAAETLLITSDFIGFTDVFREILTKRWRTLDLISMMKELKRAHSYYGVTIIDTLSSLPRLKKEEDLTI